MIKGGLAGGRGAARVSNPGQGGSHGARVLKHLGRTTSKPELLHMGLFLSLGRRRGRNNLLPVERGRVGEECGQSSPERGRAGRGGRILAVCVSQRRLLASMCANSKPRCQATQLLEQSWPRTSNSFLFGVVFLIMCKGPGPHPTPCSPPRPPPPFGSGEPLT